MARSIAARYLVAAFAFMAAATWNGVSLSGGFTCLFVFVLALQAVRRYQRRGDPRGRRSGPGRERPQRREPEGPEELVASPARPARRERSRSTGRLYDGNREEIGWPVAGEAAWQQR